MRRKDREVTDSAKIQKVIEECTCCRVGFYDDGEVYIVPLSFGYVQKEGKYTFFFHSASAGRKIDLLKQNPNVGFEMDVNYKLKTADIACEHSAMFQSIIGTGTAEIVTSEEEKAEGLSLIMEHNTGRKDWTFDEKLLKATTVFKLEVKEMSCKEHE